MHRVILGAGVVIMEGLTNLARCPAAGGVAAPSTDAGTRGGAGALLRDRKSGADGVLLRTENSPARSGAWWR